MLRWQIDTSLCSERDAKGQAVDIQASNPLLINYLILNYIY